MNYIDLIVTEILSEPYYEYHRWFIKVKAESYGVESNHNLMFDSIEDAKNIQIGYTFMA